MKRVLLLWVFFLLFVALKVNGQEVEVSSFSYLDNLMHSDSQQTISLPSTTIMSVNDYDYVGSNLKTIYGNNAVLDGGMKYCGFKVGISTGMSLMSLKIIDLTMQNFCCYEDYPSPYRYYYWGRSFFLHGALLLATGKIDFMNNGAQEGGAMLVRNSTSSFDCSVINFNNNRALSNGGAICVKDSNVLFNSSTVNFVGNGGEIGTGEWNYGGAIFVSRSVVSFSSSIINFVDNNIVNLCPPEDEYGLITQGRAVGGAIYADKNTAIDFKNTVVSFINNNASDEGGAFYVEENSRVMFSESVINFMGNKTCGIAGRIAGGAICLRDNCIISFNSCEINFTNNNIRSSYSWSPNHSGGAIYMNGNTVLNCSNSTLSFVNNNAGTASSAHYDSGGGGAIYAINSNIMIKGSARFINNRAGGKGGGIYTEGGTLTIETDEGKVTEFIGNRANDKSNAIHLEGKAIVNFNNRQGAVVNMYGAITSNCCDRQGLVNINGDGEFNLRSEELSEIGDLNIKDRSRFNLGGSKLIVVGYLRIEQEAVFNMVNSRCLIGMSDDSNYIQEGTLKMEIFERERRCMAGWGESDTLIAGKISLEESSKLEIKENGDCQSKSYMLITYRRLEGRFGSLVSLSNHDIDYEYKEKNEYEGKWIALIPKRRILEARVEEEE